MKKTSQVKAKTIEKVSVRKAGAERVPASGLSTAGNKRSIVQNHLVERVQSPSKLTVTFGEVSVQVTRPTEAAVRKGVKDSAKVIRDLGKRLLSPGVEIKRASNIPVFTADPQNPKRVVRNLDGKSEVGRFVRGKFKVDSKAA